MRIKDAIQIRSQLLSHIWHFLVGTTLQFLSARRPAKQPDTPLPVSKMPINVSVRTDLVRLSTAHLSKRAVVCHVLETVARFVVT